MATAFVVASLQTCETVVRSNLQVMATAVELDTFQTCETVVRCNSQVMATAVELDSFQTCETVVRGGFVPQKENGGGHEIDQEIFELQIWID